MSVSLSVAPLPTRAVGSFSLRSSAIALVDHGPRPGNTANTRPLAVPVTG